MWTSIRELCAEFPDDTGSSWTQPAMPGGIRTTALRSWVAIDAHSWEKSSAAAEWAEARIALKEIHRSGGNVNACHAQMCTTGVIMRHGTQVMQERWLPEIAKGRIRVAGSSSPWEKGCAEAAGSLKGIEPRISIDGSIESRG